jgi:hypothetical protein
MIGPIRGEINIAPITTAGEDKSSPRIAIPADIMTMKAKRLDQPASSWMRPNVAGRSTPSTIDRLCQARSFRTLRLFCKGAGCSSGCTAATATLSVSAMPDGLAQRARHLNSALRGSACQGSQS